MGQPEVDVRKRDDGMWEVEVNGFDYFNPKTPEIEGGDKKQIAMWSLDQDYDQRSLMPNHFISYRWESAKRHVYRTIVAKWEVFPTTRKVRCAGS